MGRSWVRPFLIGATMITGLLHGALGADTPSANKPKVDPEVIPAKQALEATPSQPAPSAPAAPTPTDVAPASNITSGPASFGGAGGGARAEALQPAVASGVAGALGSGEIQARPSSDLGQLLNQSEATRGVDVQKRNPITSDPRVRGYHVGQVFTTGDHGFFLPARQDLDTALSKFEPSSIADVIVVKGPYAVRYGPGFSFIDVQTFDTPRHDCFQANGQTGVGYNSNGGRFDINDSVNGGGPDWGFRVGYNILEGSDYKDGNGNIIPSSYNSQNFTAALGLNLTANSKLEIKALHLTQRNVEFSGLYFDIDRLDTSAYSARFTVVEQPWFDKLTADLWYNYTIADGSTKQGAKQNFLSGNPAAPPGSPQYYGILGNPFQNAGYVPYDIVDNSTARMFESSLGYRTIASWGKADSVLFSIGSDLNIVQQSLNESIRYFSPKFNLGPGGPNYSYFPGLPKSDLVDPGVFFEASAQIGDRATVKAGARADYVNTSSERFLVKGNVDLFGNVQGTTPIDRTTLDPLIFSTDPTNTDIQRNFGLWSGFLNFEYKIDDHLTGSAGVGYAQRAPTLTELYTAGPYLSLLQPGINRIVGDPHLAKEKVTQFDLGLKGDYDCVSGGVTAFYAWINDYITFDRYSNTAAGNIGGINEYVFTNTDRATLAGGEIFGQVDVTSWLTPYTSATYVQGRDLTHHDNRRQAISSSRQGQATETEPLPGIPPLEIRSGLRVHAPTKTPKWSVELSNRNVFEQALAATSLNELPTPSFNTWDLRAFWQATPSLLLTAGFENFTDRFYREHLDSRALDALYRPGSSFYLTSTYKY